MTCEPLANTGLAPLWPLGVALALVLVGVLVLLARSRRRGRRRLSAAMVLLAVAAAMLGTASGPASPALAVTVGQCTPGIGGPGGIGSEDQGNDGDTPDRTVTLAIVQTSTNAGLAPDAPASALAGIVSNDGAHSVYVTRITVSISAVTAADGSPLAACDASDYELANSEMAVNRTIDPGEGAAFGGASIGFINKPVNQDACKNATVWLRYLSS
ncbi:MULTISPECIES: hypothetical protein [Subtercola]|uniref:Uncharacterized protein n=1 Tax=Subtercola vilae TaxID=2056433 RepID=A0A4T2BXD6_9MICO|nr:MULTISPECIES: hypothetical protein [Subtercola]MEA9986462.1 hypothetical protein [Subtercola sp. RTI3]TIH34308.1 hypothetical protein D4765_13435 [Subtercola vilae]